MLCKQVDLALVTLPSQPLAGVTSLTQQLNWCMSVSSVVHGRVEMFLNMREEAALQQQGAGVSNGGSSGSGPRPCPRMVSVHELIRTLNVDLNVLGIGMHKYILCSRRGCKTRLQLRKPPSGEAALAAAAPTTTASRGRVEDEPSSGGLKYAASSCFISMAHLPRCMEVVGVPSAAHASPRMMSVALATANGHTVCAVYYAQGKYGFFDPAPGHLTLGLSAVQMTNMLGGALHMPASMKIADDNDVAACADQLTEEPEATGPRVVTGPSLAHADSEDTSSSSPPPPSSPCIKHPAATETPQRPSPSTGLKRTTRLHEGGRAANKPGKAHHKRPWSSSASVSSRSGSTVSENHHSDDGAEFGYGAEFLCDISIFCFERRGATVAST